MSGEIRLKSSILRENTSKIKGFLEEYILENFDKDDIKKDYLLQYYNKLDFENRFFKFLCDIVLFEKVILEKINCKKTVGEANLSGHLDFLRYNSIEKDILRRENNVAPYISLLNMIMNGRVETNKAREIRETLKEVLKNSNSINGNSEDIDVDAVIKKIE